jgi:hypothetical protein
VNSSHKEGQGLSGLIEQQSLTFAPVNPAAPQVGRPIGGVPSSPGEDALQDGNLGELGTIERWMTWQEIPTIAIHKVHFDPVRKRY